MTAVCLAQTTLDSREAAEAMARAVVDQRLAACVQIEGPLTSVYRWNGNVETATEWRLTFKTSLARRDALATWAASHHPYATPEWICWEVRGSPAYAKWVEDGTED